MKPADHIVIFSHGFGTRKDDRGLFPDIIASLKDIETMMFDYNEFSETERTLIARPLTEQAAMFKAVLQREKDAHPGACIDVICHSQGSVAVALAEPTGIRKAILIAPPADLSLDRLLARFKSRPGSAIDMNGESKLVRSDGSITIVPAKYWSDRAAMHPIELYNKLAALTDLTIIHADQDALVDNTLFGSLSPEIKAIRLDGDHGFKGEARKPLVDLIRKMLSGTRP